MSHESPQSGMERSLASLSLDSSRGSSGNQPPIRKADLAYNHVRFIARPGECRVWKKKMDVLCNYLKINAPPKLQAHCYRIEFRTKQRNGGYELVIKRDKAEPLFWSFYQHNRSIFPRALNRIVFDGVAIIYSLDALQIRNGKMDFEFPVSANAREGRGGRVPPKAKSEVTALPMVKIDDYFSMDEADRTALIQLLDLIVSQEMRCPLVANATRFIIDGRSLFKVPTTDKEKALCVQKIGMGEEVWTGLHMAVKADAPDQLYLNVNTSTSIFYTAKLRLVEFYAQVVHGYTLPKEIDCDRLAITPDNTRKLAGILQGTKVRVLLSNNDSKVKKFESITEYPATQLFFDYEDTRNGGRRVSMSVAQYYAQVRNIRLQFPNLPCLMFTRKATKDRKAEPCYFPLEMCFTIDEPRKFKGKLSDTQLNAFIKAAGMGPQQKRRLIDTLAATNGSYLGEGKLMNEWGVEVDRNMVEIKDATVLPYPDIQWKDCISRVNEITAEYSITEDGKEPRKMIETGSKPLAVVFIYVNGNGCKQTLDPRNQMGKDQFDIEQKKVYDKEYRENTEFFVSTLRTYGMEVLGPAWSFQYLVDGQGRMDINGINKMVEHFQEKIRIASSSQKKEFVPLFVFVFPRRHEKLYACLKYKCDVEYGVLSQVVLVRTFQKLKGNPTSNTSGQNLLLKVLAKVGGVACRIDGNQFKNVGKMTSSSTLVLAIDVSHPSREERMQALARAGATAQHAKAANRARGRHEQLPTSRVAASTAFRGFAVSDTPRSVVAVVGNVDVNQTKWGVSARIQRLGQEETVNLTNPFVDRIDEFRTKTGVVPKHIIVYRDGVSSSQFKKALYEETEALQLALEKLGIAADEVKITYIVAQKRHHTRFFASDPTTAIDKSGEPGGNTPPGLLIEKIITSRNTFDFFIQSHYGNIGTAVPTHYTVLRDDWKPSDSFWQTVIFSHCFGNARCTRPLSIPIPLHYAHLAAKRAKNNFDHYKQFESTDEYRRTQEEVVREEMEMNAITPNEKLTSINAMLFA